MLVFPLVAFLSMALPFYLCGAVWGRFHTSVLCFPLVAR